MDPNIPVADQIMSDPRADETGNENTQAQQAFTRETFQRRIQAYNEQKQVCVDQKTRNLKVHQLTKYLYSVLIFHQPQSSNSDGLLSLA